MVLVKADGESKIEVPLNLNYSTVPCNIFGIRTGSLASCLIPSECQVYQCPENKKDWWKILLSVSFSVLILTIFSFYGRKFPVLMQKFKEVMSHNNVYSSSECNDKSTLKESTTV